ncbi:monovalent Cation:Proton antiporter-2 family [Micromonas pusilla CCMP1545]|jgi:Kef-type K+ transport system membrane component KefB|uniref:Monovalent Cation:Proton antiporter-2 family n=1 Tax=Micromonas pusilla (strain CCMP1545) TaxID=564608 RepID=C1MU66_MICPC|nr:monovalent Cation:Proton antiporter-2 family [Micromonas pusilla CCMP1545]EEH56276.1 monovalent Cation:Proton antiporter-2 family [Micromonas pusilla CCMP1545]|eukprot:XP_003059144.1 monovalent Cation:Proton antiporter-2 family [Micromonas pusilla CCMP1545]
MASTLYEIARLWITFIALACGGKLGELVHAPLVGEIVVGLLLGPSGANFIPEPDGVVLLGNLGLCVLVMTGGLSIDVDALAHVGPVAIAIAVTGTLLPIALGCAFMTAAGYSPAVGVAAGTALSSTSIGMATNTMAAANALHTRIGSLVCVAAMIDDVLSLVILAVLGNVGGSSDDAGALTWAIGRPVMVSVAFVVVGAGAARVVPRVFAREWGWATRAGETLTKMKRDDVVVASMLTLTLGLVVACGAAGSTYLLGAFVGGYAFAAAPNAKDAWAKYDLLSARLASIFFLSVGMQIPLADLFDGAGAGLGIGYAVPAVLGKLATGAFVRDVGDAAVVGWAMVGRGELGFVMAREALDEGLFGDTPYVACVWALLIATLVSPVFMRRALERRKAAGGWAAGDVGAAEDGADAVEIGRHDVA